MNRKNYKIHKFGNVIISKINDEIIVLYKNKNNIYSKVFNKKNILFSGMKFIGIIFVLVLLLTFSFHKLNNINFQTNINEIDNNLEKDEKAKNDLLLSQKTDYSDEKQEEKLQIREHVVNQGDTLSEIAKEYGVSMDTICGSNRLHSYDIIQVGVKLKIPNKDGILHKIEKGQNVVDIAKRYKVSVSKIFSENELKNYDFLSVGDYLFVPDAKPLNIIPGFLWPAMTRHITSTFGWRRHPINGKRHFHQGVDIRSNYSPIRATKYGKITYTGWMGRYGKTIIIAHPGGWKSLYGHLSRIFVKKGQYVKQGQFIGRSGNTGYSTGPHLHFELSNSSRHKNPLKYLRYR